MRRRVRHGGGDQVARTDGPVTAFAGSEVHQPTVTSPAAHPEGPVILAALPRGNEQLDGAVDLGAVSLQRDLLLKRDQPLVAFLHNVSGQLTGHPSGRGARALRVLERERAGEAGAFNHVEGGLEVVFGFAGEPDDQVGGDRRVRHHGAHPVDDPEVALRPV